MDQGHCSETSAIWILWWYLGVVIWPASSQVFLLALKVWMVLRVVLSLSRPPVNIISLDLLKLKRIKFYRKWTLYSPVLPHSSPISVKAVWPWADFSIQCPPAPTSLSSRVWFLLLYWDYLPHRLQVWPDISWSKSSFLWKRNIPTVSPLTLIKEEQACR